MTSPPLRDRFSLSRLAIQNGWLTVCCWLAIAIIGLFAFSTLKYALFPDITFPVVVVNASAPGQSLADTETELTTPIERQLSELEGLNRTTSSTFAGRAVVSLEFRVGGAIAQTTTAVKQAVEGAKLPEGATYQIIPLNLNEATVVSYALLSDRLSLLALSDLADANILPTLQAIPGVLRVDLLGRTEPSGTAPSTADALADVANAAKSGLTRVKFDRQAALALQVIKQADANTLEVVDQVDAAVQTLQADLPQVRLVQAATQADYIQSATQATIDSLVGAIVIAILVIFAFLRSWRATLITALAIPLSLLGTCIVMAYFGFNLETITLLALALVIGIVVDDAIVDLENIIRHIELGESPKQAALVATEEIGLTVSVCTLTIAAVFLPVAFMGGTIGQFFKPFGLTVSAAVLVSLLVARTLSPVLAVYWLKPKRSPQIAPEASAQPSESVPTSWLERSYCRLLAWSLDHRWSVVGIAIASFIAGIAIIPLIPQGFIPQLDRGEFYLNYTVDLPAVPAATSNQSLTSSLGQSAQIPIQAGPPGSAPLTASIDPRAQLLQQTFSAADALEESVFELPEVESVLTTVGDRGQPNQGRLYIQLKGDRTRTTAAVQAQLRQDLPQQAGVTTSVEDIQFVDTGGEKPLQVALLGDDLTELNRSAIAVQAEVENRPGFADVLRSAENNTADNIVEINHQNGQRVAFISANLSEGEALGEATDQVVDIAKAIIPPDITIGLSGDSARIGEVLGSFGKTLILAVVCMLVVVFIPFGRLLEPAVVGLTLPLSVIGAMLALLITRSDFGLVSVLGLLFLLGLLDKNALLLMDYANQLRKAGMERTEAILTTGLVRLRPILMTTASSIFGMVPLALGLGAGAELRQPMAVAIIGGLVTSTLLSLVVVPVLYSLLEDIWGRKKRSSASGFESR